MSFPSRQFRLAPPTDFVLFQPWNKKNKNASSARIADEHGRLPGRLGQAILT